MKEERPEKVSVPLTFFTSHQSWLSESLEQANCHLAKCYVPLATLWHMSILQDWKCNWTSRATTQNTKIRWSTIKFCHFKNNKGTEAEMGPIIMFLGSLMQTRWSAIGQCACTWPYQPSESGSHGQLFRPHWDQEPIKDSSAWHSPVCASLLNLVFTLTNCTKQSWSPLFPILKKHALLIIFTQHYESKSAKIYWQSF